MIQRLKPIINIAGKLLWREFKNGELNLLAIALLIAVTSMSSVALITDRVSTTLLQQAGDLIAADTIVSSAESIPLQWFDEANIKNIKHASTVLFPSIVLSGDSSQLVSIKAVTKGYPLRGELKTDTKPYSNGVVTKIVPAMGEAWVDSRLFNTLQLSIGSMIEVGSSKLKVTRVISFEPDFGGNLFSAAPRLLMNMQSLEATGLIVAGSRVNYKALFAAEPQSLVKFTAWLKTQIRPSDSIQGIKDARPELKTALDRADRFFGLSALIAVMLAAIAIALAASRYSRRHQNSSAIMRTFGASQNTILGVFIIQLGILGLIASTIGLVTGYIVHEMIINYFSQFINRDLPDANLLTLLPAFSAGVLLILCFSLPALFRLKNSSPIQVMQSRVIAGRSSDALLYLPAFFIIAMLIVWQARDIELAMIYAAGIVATILILAVATLLLLSLANKFKSHLSVSWRLGLTYLTRRKLNTMIESSGFGIGMMVIIILVLVRTDLIDDWLVSLPIDTPNQFLINVQSHQLQDIKLAFKKTSRKQPTFYPMVRARLTKINNKVVSAEDYSDPRTKRLATRLFNLTWSNQLPTENDIVKGQWWDKTKNKKQFSFDEGLAQQLGIKVGDELTYYISGANITAPVTSLRKINWDSFKPNFFVISPDKTLQDFPATYISSFYLDKNNKDFLTQLVRQFPNITVIDVQSMISQVRNIMDKVTLVIEAVFMFTLVAGILVMIATMQSTHDERIRDNAIMKTLGASKRQLRKILFTEFFLIGAISSLIATLAANLISYVIATNLMNMEYQIHFNTVAASLVIGTTLITSTGLMAFWRYHKMTPMWTLRQL